MADSENEKEISSVVLNPLFEIISKEFGYDFDEYENEVLDLIELWESAGTVSIYTSRNDRGYGKAKPSDQGSAAGTIPYLIGLYHVRLLRGKDENDPLVIITFDKDKNSDAEIAHMRFMLHHDHIFGALDEKNNPQKLKNLKKIVSEACERGSLFLKENPINPEGEQSGSS